MSEQSSGISQQSYTKMPEIPEWLKNECDTINCHKGEKILVHQETPFSVYIIKKGAVIVYSMSRSGQENKIVFVTEGGVIGEMEAITESKSIIYYAKALTECELLRIPLNDFIKWVKDDVRVTWQLTKVLAEKLCNAALQSSQYVECDAVKRLIAFLSQQGVGRVAYTRQELAEACSVSMRTINRCVKRLNDNGMIGLDKGKMIISKTQFIEIERNLINN